MSASERFATKRLAVRIGSSWGVKQRDREPRYCPRFWQEPNGIGSNHGSTSATSSSGSTLRTNGLKSCCPTVGRPRIPKQFSTIGSRNHEPKTSANEPVERIVAKRNSSPTEFQGAPSPWIERTLTGFNVFRLFEYRDEFLGLKGHCSRFDRENHDGERKTNVFARPFGNVRTAIPLVCLDANFVCCRLGGLVFSRSTQENCMQRLHSGLTIGAVELAHFCVDTSLRPESTH